MSTIKGRRRSSVPEIEKKRWEGRKEGKRLGTINKPESITETPSCGNLIPNKRGFNIISPPQLQSLHTYTIFFSFCLSYQLIFPRDKRVEIEEKGKGGRGDSVVYSEHGGRGN